MKIILSFTLVTSLIAVAFASSVADVLTDIQDLFNQLTDHHKTIATLPDTGGSLLSAFVHLVHIIPMTLLLIIPLYTQTLHSGGRSVVTCLNKGTADVNVSVFLD
jgi:hypothetical protein